jgi:hypothetical protein
MPPPPPQGGKVGADAHPRTTGLLHRAVSYGTCPTPRPVAHVEPRGDVYDEHQIPAAIGRCLKAQPRCPRLSNLTHPRHAQCRTHQAGRRLDGARRSEWHGAASPGPGPVEASRPAARPAVANRPTPGRLDSGAGPAPSRHPAARRRRHPGGSPSPTHSVIECGQGRRHAPPCDVARACFLGY